MQLKVKGTIFCQSRRPERVPFDLGMLDTYSSSSSNANSHNNTSSTSTSAIAIANDSDALARDKEKLFSRPGAKPLSYYYGDDASPTRSETAAELTFTGSASSGCNVVPPPPPRPRFAAGHDSFDEDDDSSSNILYNNGAKSSNHVSIGTSNSSATATAAINLADIATIVDIAGCSDNEAHDALVECSGKN